MSRIREVLKKSKDKNNKALITFLMAGLPDKALCLDCIKAVEEGGCDILELGVPFTDPLADGEVIERFHHRGIENGLNLRKSLDFADSVKRISNLPLILFSYYNPIYKMGLDNFAEECRSAGIDGLIIPDMPLDEITVMDNYDIETIPMLAPSSTDERLQMAAELDPAFIYCVSVRGVTGVRGSLPEQEIRSYLQRVSEITRAPLAMGFGISSAEQIKTFHDYADAFVVGSFLAQIIEQNESRPDMLPLILEENIRRLKAAGVK